MKYLSKNWFLQMKNLSSEDLQAKQSDAAYEETCEKIAMLEEIGKTAIRQTESAEQKLDVYPDLETFYGCPLLVTGKSNGDYTINFADGKKIVVDSATEKENELPENCSGLTLSAAELYYENDLFELHTIFQNDEKEENEYSYLTVEGSSVKVL